MGSTSDQLKTPLRREGSVFQFDITFFKEGTS